MSLERPEAESVTPEWIRRVEGLRSYAGPPHQFWANFLQCLGEMCEGEAAVLVLSAQMPDGTQGWRSAWEWKSTKASEAALGLFRGRMRGVAESVAAGGSPSSHPLIVSEAGTSRTILSLPLRVSTGEPAGVVLVLAPVLDQGGNAQRLERLVLVSDLPGVYALQRKMAQNAMELQRFGSTLDLLLQLNAEVHFPSAAMLLCNEMANRHSCERVSLGWRKSGYIRLQAVSRLEKFEKKMSLCRSLETVMEESAEQSSEVFWPAPIGSTLIHRDHEQFAREQQVAHLCSIPFHQGDTVVGVLLLERETQPFAPDEIRHLRVFADQASRRLEEMWKANRWFPVRWWQAVQMGLVKLAGPEHTLAKVVALVSLGLVLFLVFGRMEHRVKAPFSLRGLETVFIPAPYDGFIHEVLVEKGQEVAAGQVLLRMDRTELLLEKSEILAEEIRFLREVQKAQSGAALADMQIAQARLDQARARLGIIEHRLVQSEVRTSLRGVVVEGDLKERVGAPVRQGDFLYRVAQPDRLAVEIRMGEADIHRLHPGAKGRVAFASRPDLRIPILVESIEPMAQVDQEGNYFVVRATLEAEPENWWRPGMSGVARVEAGKRSPGYILTYRTVDFLRLRFR